MNKTEQYNYLRTVLLKQQAPFIQKGTGRARGARVANVVLYFGTHLEPAALRVYELFLLSH